MTNTPHDKDDPLPESVWKLIWEFRSVQEEESRALDEWLEHLADEASPHRAYTRAVIVVEKHKRGMRVDPERYRLARTYVDAAQKQQDAQVIMTAEIAAVRPDLLDHLLGLYSALEALIQE